MGEPTEEQRRAGWRGSKDCSGWCLGGEQLCHACLVSRDAYDVAIAAAEARGRAAGVAAERQRCLVACAIEAMSWPLGSAGRSALENVRDAIEAGDGGGG